MKICSKCKNNKPEFEFYKRTASKDGLHAWCVECSKIHSKKYAAINSEKARSVTAKWRAENPERAKNSTSAWRAKNKDKIKIANEKRYMSDPEKVKNASALYRANNPAKTKNTDLKKKYGITLEKYEELFSIQNGLCEICGTAVAGGNGKAFSVDHDHATGKIRGLLCHHCNLGLGHFKDDKEVLLKAVAYLSKST